ncbi:tyrosine-protein phosphatase [Levilactobacillus wangkuiensis]|uniref:tyrosine-protein phosphatase n=1 Tax=Levilactobacillus wangkuiensis TaxID=2799566 RepID=UPI001941381E|nr:tyrosine-protein phosphatase [Levilactobacillus wangkuiensis]
MMKRQALPLAGAVNVRDLGGLETFDHRRVRTHRLLRADSLANLTVADQEKLVAYGVTTVIDTRSQAEWRQAPDKLPEWIQLTHIPLFDNDETESVQTIQRLNQFYASDAHNGYRRMLRVYRRLVLNAQPRQAYRQFFDLLTQDKPQTVVFHCTAGKDRTGLCALLLLGALGVPISQIKQDYLRTNQYCLARVVRRLIAARDYQMNANFQSSVIDLSIASPDYFDQALTLITGEFGSISNYLVDFVGVSASVIRRLQQTYLTSELT